MSKATYAVLGFVCLLSRGEERPVAFPVEEAIGLSLERVNGSP